MQLNANQSLWLQRRNFMPIKWRGLPALSNQITTYFVSAGKYVSVVVTMIPCRKRQAKYSPQETNILCNALEMLYNLRFLDKMQSTK